MIPSRIMAGVTAATLVSTFGTTLRTDPVRDAQWHLAALRVVDAHSTAKGSDVTVAVVDSGVDGTHPDLKGSVLKGIDLTGTPGDGQGDIDGHGTAMAGIVAAHGKALGIAPEARILPVRVSTGGPVSFSKLPEGIDWARTHGAQVICLAFGADDDAELTAAIGRALDADIVVVASAGNDPLDDLLEFPASLDGVVSVGATDKGNNVLRMSNRGPKLLLTAPGDAIPSTGLDGEYRYGTGTSDSAAIVAGVAALIRSKYPDLSAREVIHRMTATAIDKGAPGRDNEYGYGIVDPVAALTANVPPLTTQVANPPPSTSSQTPIWLLLAIVAGAVIVLGLVVLFFLSRRRRS